MKFLAPLLILATVIASLSLIGCGSNSDSGNSVNTVRSSAAVTNTANSNAEELSLVINFPWETEDVAWKKDDAKKVLTAVARLSSEDAKKLSEQLSSRSTGAPKQVSVEDWFPAELVAQGDTSGGDSVVEGTAFPADDLYQAPFEQGTISRVTGTDFFVIELQGK